MAAFASLSQLRSVMNSRALFFPAVANSVVKRKILPILAHAGLHDNPARRSRVPIIFGFEHV